MDSAGGAGLGRAEGSIVLRADGAINALRQVQSGLRQVGASAQSAVASARQHLEAFQAKIDSVAKSMRSLGQDLTLRLTLPLVGSAGMMIKWASDIENTMATVEVVFADAEQQVLDFANGSATALGMSEQATLQYTTSFASMLLPIAKNKEELAGMSTELTTLTADFGAFWNLNNEEAFTVIQSALAGETEAIRRYGVDVSAAAVEQKALELGLAGTTAELTEQDKALARYHLILEQTKEEQGQFARESTGMAGKLKITQARLQDVATAFGRLMLPAASKALDIVGSLIDRIEGLSDTQRAWVIGIGAAVAALGPLLMAVSYMLPALGLFAGLLAAMLSPIGLVVAAVAGLAYLFRDELRAAFDAVVERVTFGINVFRNLREVGLDPVQAALQTLATIFPQLESVITPIRGVVLNLVSAFRELVAGNFGAALESLGEAASRFGEAIRNGIGLIDWGSIGGALWSGLQSVASWVAEQVLEIPSIAVSVGQWIAGRIRDVWDWLRNLVFGGTQGDGTGGATAGNVGQISLGDVLVNIAGWAKGAWDPIKDFIEDAIGTVIANLETVILQILNFEPIINADVDKAIRDALGARTVQLSELLVDITDPKILQTAAEIGVMISAALLALGITIAALPVAMPVLLTLGGITIGALVGMAIIGWAMRWAQENTIDAVRILMNIAVALGNISALSWDDVQRAIRRKIGIPEEGLVPFTIEYLLELVPGGGPSDEDIINSGAAGAPGENQGGTGGGWELDEFMGSGRADPFAGVKAAIETGMSEVRSLIETRATEWSAALQAGVAPLGSIAGIAFGMVRTSADGNMAATSSAVGAHIGSILATSVSNFGAMVASAITNFTTTRTTGISNVTTLSSSVGSTLGSMAVTAGATFANLATRAISETSRMRSGTISQAASAAGGIVSELVSGGARAVSGFGAQIGRLAGTVAASGGGAIGSARSLGVNIGAALASGLESMGYRVGQAAANLVNQASAAIALAAQIRSPSRVFMRLGEFLGKGFVIGIEHLQRAAHTAARDLVNVPGMPRVRYSTSALSGLGSMPYTSSSSVVNNYYGGPEVGTVQIVQQPGQDGRALYREFVEGMEQDYVGSGGIRRRGR